MGRSSEIAMSFPVAEGEVEGKLLSIDRTNVENLIDIMSGNRRNRRLREKLYEERRKHRALLQRVEACTYHCLRRLDEEEDDEDIIEDLYKEYEQNNLYIDEKRQYIEDLQHELIDVTDQLVVADESIASSATVSTPTPPQQSQSYSINVMNSMNANTNTATDNTRLRQSLGLRRRNLDAQTVTISV